MKTSRVRWVSTSLTEPRCLPHRCKCVENSPWAWGVALGLGQGSGHLPLAIGLKRLCSLLSQESSQHLVMVRSWTSKDFWVLWLWIDELHPGPYPQQDFLEPCALPSHSDLSWDCCVTEWMPASWSILWSWLWALESLSFLGWDTVANGNRRISAGNLGWGAALWARRLSSVDQPAHQVYPHVDMACEEFTNP